MADKFDIVIVIQKPYETPARRRIRLRQEYDRRRRKFWKYGKRTFNHGSPE